MKSITVFALSWLMVVTISFAQAATESDARGFSHRVIGEATLANGEEKSIDYLFGFHESSRGWYFRIGRDHTFRDSPPSAYYLTMILDGEGHAYVLDFSEEPLKGFQVQIEDYEIELMQASGTDINYGMRLRINDRQFLFDSRHPRLRLELSEQGLEDLVAERTLRDLSIRRTQ